MVLPGCKIPGHVTFARAARGLRKHQHLERTQAAVGSGHRRRADVAAGGDRRRFDRNDLVDAEVLGQRERNHRAAALGDDEHRSIERLDAAAHALRGRRALCRSDGADEREAGGEELGHGGTPGASTNAER
jgi:hypothetical protein